MLRKRTMFRIGTMLRTNRKMLRTNRIGQC